MKQLADSSGPFAFGVPMPAPASAKTLANL
jgi:hypothetical protein